MDATPNPADADLPRDAADAAPPPANDVVPPGVGDPPPPPPPPPATNPAPPPDSAVSLSPPAPPAGRARSAASWRNWGDHPVVTLITVLAGIVAIVSYIRHDQAAAPTCADVVGRWDWLSTGGVVAFTEDGLMHWYRVAADPVPLVNGTWVCRDRSPLHLTLTWTETRLVDTLVVSADGQRLAGENLKNSFKLSATRQR